MAAKQAQQNSKASGALEKRPPVVAVMGHIDHGKSTLLDYIRKSNVVDTEAGGITQRISAYEVVRSNERITFIDTPGHEAFAGMRERGATTADIAILVVSAEDGVKKQTIEAYSQIKAAGVPCIVAINKIDKPAADVERAKMSLAENEIYLEGFGGTISYVPISAKTGQGVEDLLDLIVLTADVADLKGDASLPASGTIIEANRDPKKGISATIVIKNGSIGAGMFIAAGKAFAPSRILEDHTGKKIASASFSSPIRVIGWDEVPKVGAMVSTFTSKKDLEAYLEAAASAKPASRDAKADEGLANKVILPVIVKADVLGSVEAIEHELRKVQSDRVAIKIILASIGGITESDIKIAGSGNKTLVVGFNVKADSQAKALIERLGLSYATFDIIYKLVEWVTEKVAENRPKVEEMDVLGKAKILKCFSAIRDKQIIGGKVTDRELQLGHKVKISRRETVIGEGVVRELQQAKIKTSSVPEGFEFGAMIESKIELAPGDVLEDYIMVER